MPLGIFFHKKWQPSDSLYSHCDIIGACLMEPLRGNMHSSNPHAMI